MTGIDRRPRKNRVHVLVKVENKVYVADNTWLYRQSVGVWAHLNLWPVTSSFLRRKGPLQLVKRKLFGDFACEAQQLDARQLDLFIDEHFLLFSFAEGVLPKDFFVSAHWLLLPEKNRVQTRFEQACREILLQKEPEYRPYKKRHGFIPTA